MNPSSRAEAIAELIIDECWLQTELTKPKSAKRIIAQALEDYGNEKAAEMRELGFHEGKEFAIITIGTAICSESGKDVPFLAYQEAVKALRKP